MADPTNDDSLTIAYMSGYHAGKKAALASQAPTQPTEFDEAVAAVDATLHHAVDHWQDRALRAEKELAALRAQPVRGSDGEDAEHVDLLGIRADGSAVNLGKVAMPARMKAREIVRNYIGEPGNPDDDFDDSEATQALRCCLDLIDYAARATHQSTTPGEPHG